MADDRHDPVLDEMTVIVYLFVTFVLLSLFGCAWALSLAANGGSG